MTRYLFLVLLMIGLAGGTVQAQTLDDLRGSTAAYYRFANPDDIAIEVKVWGSLQYPGFYEVPQGTRLSTLLTLAGGPLAVRDAQTRQVLTIRLWRPQPNGEPHQTISETRMEDEIFALNEDPVLFSGDIVVADELVKQRFGWRDGLSILTSVGTLILIIERLAE